MYYVRQMPCRRAEATKYRKEQREEEEGIVLELDEEEGGNEKAEMQ